MQTQLEGSSRGQGNLTPAPTWLASFGPRKQDFPLISQGAVLTFHSPMKTLWSKMQDKKDP